ncbi:conserved protein of unknown function [Blastococcus saxobsidens DD2]|uniref:HIRAN domain-containing protein n=1 Tax=Blastococcus saxobsidens (strain DD2) TaxID=1146883 RepID=H6RJE1_BLASD|nr:conserved protein of unknown function [Blastococcus saxobsidens DD2]
MSATETAPRGAERADGPVVRRLAVTWQHPETRQISPVALLEFDGSRYHFNYIRNAESVDGFRPLLGFPELRRTYESDHLFPLFAQRVMDTRRPDHDRYVQRLGLSADATPWEQMARSGGGREGDVLQLFPEPETLSSGELTCSFLVHGVRHVPSRSLILHGVTSDVTREDLERRLMLLSRGQRLRLISEPQNPVNPSAVITAMEDGFPLGWVPDLFLNDLHAMTSDPESADVVVEHVNGPEAPPHLRLLVRLTAVPRPMYRPFSGDSWEPLSSRA